PGRRLPHCRGHRRGGRRQAVRRRAGVRRLDRRPAAPAQRRPARPREDQGLAGGRTERHGGVSSPLPMAEEAWGAGEEKPTAVVLPPETSTATRSPAAGTYARLSSAASGAAAPGSAT